MKNLVYSVATMLLLAVAIYPGPRWLEAASLGVLAPYVTAAAILVALQTSRNVRWLARFVRLLGDNIPFVNSWLEAREQAERHQKKADDLARIIRGYHLWKPVSWTPARIRALNIVEKGVKRHAQEMATQSFTELEPHLAAPAKQEVCDSFTLLGQLLPLLYDEQEKAAGASLHSADEATRHALAKVLIDSGKLHGHLRREHQRYFGSGLGAAEEELVQRFLSPASSFRLVRLAREIEDELDRVRSKVEEVAAYLDFYGLVALTEERKEELIRRLLDQGPPYDAGRFCADELSAELGCPGSLLSLLCRERASRIPVPLPVADTALLVALAAVLVRQEDFRREGFGPRDLELVTILLHQAGSFRRDVFLADLRARLAASRQIVARLAKTGQTCRDVRWDEARRQQVAKDLLVHRGAELAAGLAVGAREFAVPYSVFALLYHEHDGGVAAPLWPPSADVRRELARVLVASGRLPCEHLESADLERLLGRLETFQLDDLATRLRRIDELRSFTRSYLAFLGGHGFAEKDTRLDLALLLDLIESPPSGEPYGHTDGGELDDAELCFRILVEMGRQRIDAWIAGAAGRAVARAVPDSERVSLSLLCLILFLTRTLSHEALRETACKALRQTAEQRVGALRGHLGVLLAWAFLEAKRDFRSGNWASTWKYLRLCELIPKWRSLVEERQRRSSGFGREIETLERQLRAGDWFNHKEDLMEQAFGIDVALAGDAEPSAPTAAPATAAGSRPAAAPVAAPIHAANAPRWTPGSKEALKRLFLRLELDTIERFLETRAITPYVLTVRAKSGPVQRLLDCLTAKSGGVREKLEEKGVHVLVAPADAVRERTARERTAPELDRRKYKYNFKPYTHYTRIGVLPLGVTFRDFCQRFQADFKKVIETQDELLDARWVEEKRSLPRPPSPAVEDYEILLHAFNPSGHNPFAFGEPATSRPAMERIKRLFAEVLSEQDLASILLYAGAYDYEKNARVDWVALLLDAPIPGIADDYRALTAEERRHLRAADHRIWHESLRLLRLPDEADVADVLRAVTREEAVGALARAIVAQVPALAGGVKPGTDPAEVYLKEVLVTGLRRDVVKRLKIPDSLPKLARALRIRTAEAVAALAAVIVRHIPSLSDEKARELAAAIARHVSSLAEPAQHARRLATAYLECKADQRIKRAFLDELGIDGDHQKLRRALSERQPADRALAAAIGECLPELDDGERREIARAYRCEVQAQADALTKLSWTIGHAELMSCGVAS